MKVNQFVLNNVKKKAIITWALILCLSIILIFAITQIRNLSIQSSSNIIDPKSNLAVVNKRFYLSKYFVPKDLIVPDVNFVNGITADEKRLRKEAASALENMFYYTISFKDKIIGGINVCKLSEFTYRIKRVYIDQNYQNRGLGREILAFIEGEFPEAREWTLDTPKLNLRNQHFYEKAGYKKIGETAYSEKLVLIDYRKTMGK